MKVTVQDSRYFQLKDIDNGHIAVSYPHLSESGKGPLQHRIFASVYLRSVEIGANNWQVVELTELNSQYHDTNVDTSMLVRYLAKGECVEFLQD
jgi:hypothetical protein